MHRLKHLYLWGTRKRTLRLQPVTEGQLLALRRDWCPWPGMLAMPQPQCAPSGPWIFQCGHFRRYSQGKAVPQELTVTHSKPYCSHCLSHHYPYLYTQLKKKILFFVFIPDSEEHHGLEKINLCRCLSFLGEREEENSGVILLGFLKMIWYYQMLPVPGHLWVSMFYKTKQMHWINDGNGQEWFIRRADEPCKY